MQLSQASACVFPTLCFPKNNKGVLRIDNWGYCCKKIKPYAFFYCKLRKALLVDANLHLLHIVLLL